MKYQSPSQLRSTLIRVYKEDYALLKATSEERKMSIADVVSYLTPGPQLNERTLLKAEIAGLGSMLLDVQQDCIKERKKVAALFEEMICPMCYRLNPQHASMDKGKGCQSCEDKENWLNNEN